MLDRRPGLHQADRQQADRDHGEQAPVDGPERDAQQPFLPLRVGPERAQHEQHQAEAQHAVDAEERGVAVHGRGVQALHVVERDRRVDHEAEQARADQVPERHRHEEVDRPPVPAHPRPRAGELQVVPRLEPDEEQRHHLERREDRAERQRHGGRAAEVQVVQRADDAARQEDGGRQHAGLAGALQADQAQAREEERDHDGREHLEEAFHPEVDDPPAPVLGHGEVGVPAGAERGAVEAGNRDDRDREEHQDRPLLVAALERRQDGAHHQEQPQEEAGEQRDLPHAPEVDVLVARCARTRTTGRRAAGSSRSSTRRPSSRARRARARRRAR